MEISIEGKVTKEEKNNRGENEVYAHEKRKR